jgi:hypothetical protein
MRKNMYAARYQVQVQVRIPIPFSGYKSKFLFNKMFEKPPFCNNEVIRSSTFSLFSCAICMVVLQLSAFLHMQCALLSVEYTVQAIQETLQLKKLPRQAHT